MAETLERRQLDMLVRLRSSLKDYIEAMGECDHSVGICCCEEVRLYDEAGALIREARGSTPRKTGECLYACPRAIFVPGPEVWICEQPAHWVEE